jgi:EAL domain-containing protein (putative c-di-GMP-specific phosphodiesterase class I)
MSADGTAGNVKDHCERSALRILPPLQKPADRAALKRIVQEHKLESSATALERTSLDEALKRNWVEFWYQPKIDLRKKQLSGVELFARIRHPERGIMLPGAFMDDADVSSLVGLTELSLVNALKVGLGFSKLGISFRLAVNVSIAALMKLHIPQIVRECRPENDSWPGLLLDVTEDQIATDLAIFRELSTQLELCNIKLAIDDFGRGYLPLGRLKEVRFTELKLDRSFVADCATDKTHAAICRSVIDLSHNFNATAVAVGVEKPADAHGAGAIPGSPEAARRDDADTPAGRRSGIAGISNLSSVIRRRSKLPAHV